MHSSHPRHRVAKSLKCLFDFLSGEYWMLVLAPQNNAGWIVFLRALWIVLEVVLALEVLRVLGWVVEQLNTPFPFVFKPLPDSAAKRLMLCLSELRSLSQGYKTELLGIFGGAYAALYARFSSQWQYLAQLYNQIKSQEIAIRQGGAARLRIARFADSENVVATYPWRTLASPSNDPEQLLAEWMKGFIEDAFAVHLARKQLFRTVIASWAQRERVRDLLNGEQTTAEVREGVAQIIRDVNAAVEV